MAWVTGMREKPQANPRKTRGAVRKRRLGSSIQSEPVTTTDEGTTIAKNEAPPITCGSMSEASRESLATAPVSAPTVTAAADVFTDVASQIGSGTNRKGVKVATSSSDLRDLDTSSSVRLSVGIG
jgi:hypothetical protein